MVVAYLYAWWSSKTSIGLYAGSTPPTPGPLNHHRDGHQPERAYLPRLRFR
ncbi:MAG: hypothetical protein M3N25_03545 [Actinomycetota bacterium]|nr:hypothetical protein [Actinomycetota bacterium]